MLTSKFNLKILSILNSYWTYFYSKKINLKFNYFSYFYSMDCAIYVYKYIECIAFGVPSVVEAVTDMPV